MELNPRFRFESFVVGGTNRLAATAAQTVSVSPGGAYNPLFVYAKSGLGKTHLLQAIGFEVLERWPELRVQYLTLEEFVEQYHAAVAAGQVEAFRKGAADQEVLLLDDVQFLARHREMQAELLRLGEALQASGRQLVFTSDRPPSEIEALDERLISRLSGGLLVDMAAPDFETRLAILRRKAEERAMSFALGVLEAVAELSASNVRELVGMVNRLVAFQAVSETPLSPEGARALLTGEVAPGPAAVAPPAAAVAVPAEPAPAHEEFSAFLSVVSRTVAQSLDAWRPRIGEAVMRWQGEGYRTARLEQMLLADTVPEADAILAQFAADVEELRQLAEKVGQLDPAAAGHARFRDPDRLEEARAFAARMREGMVPPPVPSPALTFGDFIVGEANQAAVRAARLIAAEPGRRYNPLFIAGPSGVGKTHLLHAVGNALAAVSPGAVVACLSAQAFVEELVAAIEGARVDWWRRRYRRAHALLIDDVQLLAGKEGSQEELFNLFNLFAEAGRQLVFSADRIPGLLQQLAPRLISRFEGGLVIELEPPDRLMREEMVRRLLEARGVGADAEVVEYLAARPADSARAVQGHINRALARREPGDEKLSLEVVRTAIEGRASRVSHPELAAPPVPGGLDAVLSSREKVVWDWPDTGERLVEELR